LGTIITPWGKLWAKNDKNGPKIDKNCAKIALFLYFFRICSLKIFVCRTDGQKTLYWTENRAHDSSESIKQVIPKITSWKSRGARAPVPIAGDPMVVTLEPLRQSASKRRDFGSRIYYCHITLYNRVLRTVYNGVIIRVTLRRQVAPPRGDISHSISNLLRHRPMPIYWVFILCKTENSCIRKRCLWVSSSSASLVSQKHKQLQCKHDIMVVNGSSVPKDMYNGSLT